MISVTVAHSASESLSAYCLARLLALRSGCQFAFPQLRNLVRNWQAGGRRFIGGETGWLGQWPFESRTGRKVTLAEMATTPHNRLRLAGGFHRFDLIASERDRVLHEWVVPVESMPKRRESEFAICLSSPLPIEKGVEYREDHCLNENNVRRLVRSVRYSRLTLIADRGDHPVIPMLKDFPKEIVVCRGWKQLLLIASFQKVAISQDATQWWGAFLGDAAEIYFPQLDQGPWSHPEAADLVHEPWWHGIDLQVRDEERWIYDW